MKWKTIIIALLVLTTQATAVKLEYTRFFPECSFYDRDLSLGSLTRCGCYFFIPNAHMEAGYDLTIKAFGDGVWQLITRELTYVKDFFTEDILTTKIFTLEFLIDKFKLLFNMTLEPFTLMFDVGSGVLAYLLLLMFEFIKTYLFWFIVPAAAWNLVFYGIAVLMNQPYAFKGGGILLNPLSMGLLVTGAILIGSILLVLLDFSIFNLRLI